MISVKMFDLARFIEDPSLKELDSCRKDDLLTIATHLNLPLPSSLLKSEIKHAVLEKLTEVGLLPNWKSTSAEFSDEAAASALSCSVPLQPVTQEEVKPPSTPGSPKSPVRSQHSGDKVKWKVHLARLQMEAEERDKDRKAEFELRYQIKKLEIEAEKEVKLKRLEIEALEQKQRGKEIPVEVPMTPPGFDVCRNIALVPSFRESEVDSFFGAFERIALSLKWPREVWPLLLQCKLTGKAQEVASSLTLEDSLQYDKIKETVLRAYELVPEAYRQKFRGYRKNSSQTFVEFAREKGALFDKWCNATKTFEFNSLRELILLEDFKGSLPDKIVTYLNEQKVSSLSRAAVLSDEFLLTHKNVFVSSNLEKSTVPRPSKMESVSLPDRSRQGSLRDTECFYCHKRGHILANCLNLKRKQQFTASSSVSSPKGVGLIKSLAVGDVKESFTQPSHPDPCFKPFIFQGLVSLTGSPADQKPVQILRDTGGSQSFILADVLTLSEDSSCKSSTVVQGIEMGFVPAPLHTIHVQSKLVTGFFKIAVLPELPVKGVHFIMCNDLAGGKVLPVPEIVDRPDLLTEMDSPVQCGPEVFPACVVTRAQTKKFGMDLSDTFLVSEMDEMPEKPKKKPVTALEKGALPKLCSEVLQLPATRKDFIEAQQSDVTIAKCLSSVLSQDSAKGKNVAYFLDDGVLMRKWTDPAAEGMDWGACYQVVVPLKFRQQVLSLAHDHPWSGHLGVTKTYHKILKHFFWPALKTDVTRYCRSCHTCQVTGKPNQVIPPAPLHPVLAMGEPFKTVLMDCVGPLPKSKSGNQFLLTIMCTATRFPEAIPLRTITAKAIIKAMTKFFTTFGLPKIVQTDQGTNFKSKMFAQVLKSLNIVHKMSSTYHPQSQGAIERFHQTLKSVLRKHCLESQRDWDESIPLVLFAVREAVQESLGFSPAQLVFGHSVRGPLQVLKEQLVDSEKRHYAVSEYVSQFQERLRQACSLAKEALVSAQVKMKRQFDRKAVDRSFKAGDKVLILSPTSGSALSVRFFGPYDVERKLSETNYVIHTPDQRRKSCICHVNRLKRYHPRGTATEELINNGPPISAVGTFTTVVPTTKTCGDDEDGLVLRDASASGVRLSNSEVLLDLTAHLSHLSGSQKADVEQAIHDFPELFTDIPSQTSVLKHDLKLLNNKPIKQRAYRVNPTKRKIMKEEVEYLLANDFAKPSSSPWSSPCLLDVKSDGSNRFCTDFRRVNAVTVPDAYPLPLMDDCIDEIGSSTYVSKLDMLKGYWQVPLTPEASEISAFVTPDYFSQYTVMPFGMCNAPATFQRLINLVLGDIQNCKAYLDDIVLYDTDWSSHVLTLRKVFKRLSDASLTLNLAKCDFGKGTIQYLGKQVGQGQVRPVDAKVAAVAAFPVPTSRREMRRFLGMAGYYRRFCKNFSTVVAPLTALTSPVKTFSWSTECQNAFDNVKAMLCCAPVLAAPNFMLPFKLEVDACATGAGAVLLQEDNQGLDHPVCYFSRKFDKHQLRYSTIEKETLALLLALQHFEVYVGGSMQPVVVYTDHNPLVFLSRMYNQNQRLMRWALIVQNYNLNILHKKGSENVLADALSRT